MAGEFNSFILNATIKHSPTPLPLTHITDALVFRDITISGKLVATEKCDVFNEELLYFFYGRPAYRLKSDGYSTSLNAHDPVCLILKPDIIASTKK